MRGIDNTTGKTLDGLAHLKQSIRDILSTPIGTRVMRREYGSRLPRLVDAPLNPDTVVEIYAATAEALQKWEPRFGLQSVTTEACEPGKITLTLTGVYLPDGREITMDGVEVVA